MSDNRDWQADMERKIGELVQVKGDNMRYDWTIRLKKWHEETGQSIYFITRPGYEGWFSNAALMDKEAEA
ncbi:hypothetical protein [Paenibacillus sp. XY044]|uniref:hypothetical protein n=1 Tax=Paenibacillus sp. XY044 TaxID=2026089 RepID=UPI000B98124C|nr:hypothetical protein [Paenibacillus sp. XY044]OZB98161.1 hypothetical protein CJP46_03050 [Paenibacillus sp. XY044]